MAVSIPQVVTEDRASGALVIDGSLRFDKSKSQYLTRTPSSTGNRKKSTISYWIKRTIPVADFSPTTASVFGVDGTSSWFDLSYYTVDEIQFILTAGSGDTGMRTQASYRDFSNWYHVCAVIDTDRTNDDGANSRMRVWINGEETVQKATSSGQPAAGTFTYLNDSNRAHFIGRDGRTSSIRYGDNYLAQFYIVDGLVLGPDHFGYYDPLTNVWRPKKFTADGTTINDGRSWSGTSSVSNNNGNANGAGSLAAVFNGTMTANDSNAYGFTTGAMDFTWTPNTPISFGSQVRVWTGWSGGTVYLNGTEEIVTTNNNAWTTLTNGRSGKITSIRFVGGSGGGWWAGVEVDGVVLVDSTTQNLDFGTNGCYLPLDGNSPIGQDQSGKGNNWTPVNFGGSAALDKATGAKPILDTLGGTIAKSGVFGSEVSKNYTILGTSGGGNPYVFEDLGNQPQLSFIRGATYTFDYTAASSHPLFLSSLQNGKWNSKAYSVSFDGTGDALRVADHADLRFGTGAFTIECYVWFNSFDDNYPSIISKYTGGTASWIMRVRNTGKAIFYTGVNGGTNNESSGTVISLNRWHHIAMVREGTGSNQSKMYVDGKLVVTCTDGTDYTDTQEVTIGAQNASDSNVLNGYMSNVRIIKGTALYTSNFTPPGTTLTNVTGTTLLCCQDSAATTAAVIPSGSITVAGNPAATQAKQPFLYDSNHGNFGVNTATSNVTKITVPHIAADTLYYYCNSHTGMGNSISVTTDETKADPYAWKCVFAAPLVGNNLDVSNQINCTSTTKATTTSGAAADSSDSNFYGGSYVFDGSNDYVKTDANSADFNFGSGDFTLECWINADYANSISLFSLWDYQNSQRSWNLYVNSNTQVVLITSTNGSGQSDVVGPTANTKLTLNKWTHVVVTKESNTYRCFIDGDLKESNSVTETIYNNTNDPIYIGATNGVTEWFNGHMQDVRIYKGVAKYTSNFIPASTNPNILPDTPSGVGTKTQLTKIPSSDSNTLLFPTQGSKIVLGNQYTPIDGTGDYTISFWFFASEYNSADNNGGDGGFDYILTQAATHPTYPIGVHVSKAGKIIVQDSANFGSTWLSTFDYAGSYNTDYSIALGQWSYVHVVRSSGTLSIYNNGNLQYSRSQSSASPTPTGDITITLNTGKCFVKDLRIEGAAITDATPPTGSPTATGNTRLLLDGLNDVSGNNVALTVTGDVQRDKLSPFITNDINTIRGQESGYATWNPLTKGSRVTLSNGNLDVTSTASSGQAATMEVVANIGTKSGKYYVEWTNISNRIPTLGNYAYGGTQLGVYSGGINNSLGGTTSGSGFSFTSEDVIALAVDFDNKIAYVYKNNILEYTADYTTDVELFFKDIVNGSGSGGTSNANFGQKPFKFPPPDGFQPLTSSTVRPDTVISRPDQYVRTTLYTGDDNDGRTITLGHEADLVWVKGRNAAAGHVWQDTVRGPGQTVLATHSSALQTTETYGQISAFTKNGITVTSGSTSDENINYPSRTYVAWSWKAGGSKGTFNVDDVGYATAAAAGLSASGNSWDSDPTGASIGTKQGFSIIKHSGTGSTGSLPHGLTQKPDLLITKAYNGTTGNWNVYTDLFDGSNDYMYFNDNAHKGDSSLSAFTSELFYYGYTTNDYIHYLWHSVPGLQKFGVYTGNSSTNFVSLDFRPALIWVKRAVANSSSDTSTNNSAWTIMDSTRLSYNGLTPNHLYSDWTASEGKRGDGSGTSGLTDMTLEPMSNGFYLNGPASETNSNTGTFLYCAWAEAPAFNLYGATSNAR